MFEFLFFSRQNSKKCPNGFIDIDSGKNEEETGNCIFIIPPMDFKASRKICEYLGGHLARPVLGSKREKRCYYSFNFIEKFHFRTSN